MCIPRQLILGLRSPRPMKCNELVQQISPNLKITIGFDGDY